MKNEPKLLLLISVLTIFMLLVSSSAFSEIKKSGIGLMADYWPSNDDLLCIDKITTPIIDCRQNGGYGVIITNALALSNSTPEVFCSINVSTKRLVQSRLGEVALEDVPKPTVAFIEIGGVHGDRSIQLRDLDPSDAENPIRDLKQFLNNINPSMSFLSNNDYELALPLATMMKSRLCSNHKPSKTYTQFIPGDEEILTVAESCTRLSISEACFTYKSMELTSSIKRSYRVTSDGSVDYNDFVDKILPASPKPQIKSVCPDFDRYAAASWLCNNKLNEYKQKCQHSDNCKILK